VVVPHNVELTKQSAKALNQQSVLEKSKSKMKNIKKGAK
jgi:hypothetical protein